MFGITRKKDPTTVLNMMAFSLGGRNSFPRYDVLDLCLLVAVGGQPPCLRRVDGDRSAHRIRYCSGLRKQGLPCASSSTWDVKRFSWFGWRIVKWKNHNLDGRYYGGCKGLEGLILTRKWLVWYCIPVSKYQCVLWDRLECLYLRVCQIAPK
jgi:hypothetical protein